MDADAAAEAEAKKSQAYSEDMQKKMGTTLTYRRVMQAVCWSKHKGKGPT